MSLTALAPHPDAPRGNLHRWQSSWRRSLRGAEYADKTIEVYTSALDQFARFVADPDNVDDDGLALPQFVEDIKSEHIDMFLDHLRTEGRAKATVNQRFRSLQQFFKYVEDETTRTGDAFTSPMLRMKPPRLEEVLVPVVDDHVVAKLLDTCKGNRFEDVRDAAIIRLFVETGVRRSEMTSMTIEETGRLDLDFNTAVVMGKGSRERQVNFGPKSAKALDRYLRLRARHPDSTHPALWLGRRGPMLSNGVLQMVKRRCKAAGVPPIHPHQFRHTFAHNWLVDGGQETDLMRLQGWKSRSMVDRYAKSAADKRAAQAYKRQRPGDRY